MDQKHSFLFFKFKALDFFIINSLNMIQNKKIEAIESIFEKNFDTQTSFAAEPRALSNNFQAQFVANRGFVIKKKITSEKLTQVSEPVIVQIEGNHIFLLIAHSKTICGFVECSFDTKFQILKLDSQNPKWDDLTGIKFLKEEQDQNASKQIQILIQSKQFENFQAFLEILQKKNIVQRNFHPQFQATRRIGRGVTACVYEAVRLRDRKRVAIKSFKKSSYFGSDNGKGKEAFIKEMKILSEISHPGLGTFNGVFQSENSIYIIFDLLPISLFCYLKKNGIKTEQFTRKAIRKLLQSLSFLHKKQILHRDLKLDNLMLKDAFSNDPQPVIIDFGLAEYTHSEKVIYQRCGTPGYVAPQVLSNNSCLQKNKLKHKKESDIYSLGVIFYIMITGRSPFEGSDPKQVLEKNKNGVIDFTLEPLNDFSLEGIAILKMMLQSNPLARVTADQALQHSYFADKCVQGEEERLKRRLSTQVSIPI